MDIFGIHEMVITESALITMMQKCRLTRFTWVPHQKKKWFGFVFKADTLKIHRLNCAVFDTASHNYVAVELGKLEYTLRKKD